MISVLFIKSTQKALEREGEGEGSLVEATEIKDLDMVKRATFLLQGEQLAAAYGSVRGTVPSTQLHTQCHVVLPKLPILHSCAHRASGPTTTLGSGIFSSSE